MENTNEKREKRGMLKIVDDVYSFLEKKGEVHQSALREIVPSPSNRHILDIIQAIQEKPYLHINQKGRYTTIRLDEKKRSEESFISHIENLYEKVDQKIIKLKEMEQQNTVSQIFLVYEYKSALSSIKQEIEKILNENA